MSASEALRRFFFAAEPIARVVWFRRGLALWTAVLVASQLPYLEELYCRPVLREGIFDRWLGLPPPPLGLVVGLVAVLLGALALVLLDVATRRAQWVALALFALLVGLDGGKLLGYTALALIQWCFVALAPTGPPAREAPRWTTRLMMLQLSAMYVFAALVKLLEAPGWRDGKAIARIFSSPHYARHLLSLWIPAGDGWWTVAIAWSTIALELFIGFGLWHRKTRLAAALALVSLHLGIALTMRVTPFFHTLMALHLVLFVGPDPRRGRVGGGG